MNYDENLNKEAYEDLKKKKNEVGVRDYLVSAGLDNSKIGWDGSNVTYGGRSFTPTRNENGITFASKDAVDSFIGDIQKDNGNLGVRSTLTGLGVNPSKIGWDGKNVTVGAAKYTPSVNANGTTYGKAQDVYNFADAALKRQGDGIVRVNQYRSNNGLYDVGWSPDTKQVLIGGESVPYAYIDDSGNAWAKKSVLDEAYERLADRNGIRSFSDMNKKYDDRAEALKKEYDDIAARRFTFSQNDLENDPVWLAYKAMYAREADRAYDDAISKAAARTGGNMSSMAMAQADQQRQYYLDKMTDQIPQLAQMAYERYLNDNNIALNTVGQKANITGQQASNDYEMNRAAYDAYNMGRAAERERVTNNFEDRFNNIELQSATSDLEKLLAQNDFDIADMFNTPIPASLAAKYGVMPYEDGTYPTPNQIINRKQNEAWDDYGRRIYEEQQDINLANALTELAAQYGYKEALEGYKNSLKKKTGSKSSTKSSTKSSGGGSIDIGGALD